MNLKIFNYKFLLLAFVFAGCKKSLDLAPQDQISDVSFWKEPADFQLAANDFYYGLMDAAQYVDENSDIAFGSLNNAVSNGTHLPPQTSETWTNAYKYIRTANNILEKAEQSELGTAIDRWVGEAYFFRAYHYWKLAKTFGGVPKIEKVLQTTSEELYSARASQQEIFDLILADLEKAAAMLPAQSGLTGDESGRTTSGAALALKARAALYQGTWMKYHGAGDASTYLAAAVDAANQLIESGEYELYNADGAMSYKYLHILKGDDSKEVILAKRYYEDRATHNWTRELWFNRLVPTKRMADMYLATDGLPIDKSPLFQGYNTLTSEFQNRDPRMSMTFIVPGSTIFFEGGLMQETYPGFSGNNATRTGYMLRKFLDETEDAAHFLGAYDFKEFRYGEVLLILAEALYEQNGNISDADLDRTINLLRERAGMTHLTNNLVQSNNLDMLTEIRRERTVELAFEGYRRDDLRRWKTAELLMPEAVKGVKFEGSEFEARYPDLEIGTDIQVDEDGFIVATPASSRQFLPKHYLDPLPLREIQLSKGSLEQNTGWQ